MNDLWFWMALFSALLLGIQFGARFEKYIPIGIVNIIIIVWFIIVVTTYIKTR